MTAPTTSLFALLLAIAPVPALASGFLVARFGGEHGHPTTDNPTAIYYNPAGLSLLGGTRLFVDGALAWRSLTFNRDPGGIDNLLEDGEGGAGTPVGDGVAANSGEASLFNVLGNPFFGVATDFGVKGLGVGLAFYVPFGGSTVFDDAASSDLYPGAIDGPARWWVIEGTIRSMYLSTALSYRFEDARLSIGAGFNLILSQMNTVRARNADGSDHLVSGGRLQEGRGLIDASGVHASFSLGVIWEPIDHLLIGASYQAQPGLGNMVLDSGEMTLILGGGPTDDIQPIDVEVHQQLPDVLRVGARYGAPRAWEVRLFGEYARWSVLTDHCILDRSNPARRCSLTDPIGKVIIIPRKWKDAFGVRAGGSWWPSENVELYLGAGYDGNAVPDAFIDPALYDAPKGSIALGVKLDLIEDSLILSASYTQIIYGQRVIAPRGRVPVDPNDPDGATMSDISDLGVSEDVRQPDAAGTYDTAIGLLDVNLEYRF